MKEKSALIASYGSKKQVVATTVSIVIKAKKELLEHKTFYAQDFSSMEDYMKAITAYALERTTNKELGMVWKILPIEELDRLCPDCGEPTARVPWL
jgi:hypothetical protein